jgi:hypothetical protein
LLIDKFSKDNVKGHVTVDLIKEGKVVDTFTNHNLVVNDSTKIIAKTLADPDGYKKAEYTHSGSTTTYRNQDGWYEFQLPYARCELLETSVSSADIYEPTTFDINYGVADKVIQLEESLRPVDAVVFARGVSASGDKVLLKNEAEIFVIDSDKGLIGLNHDVTPYTSIELRFYKTINRSVNIFPGSEEVKTSSLLKRSVLTNELGQIIPEKGNALSYGIDYKSGKLLFDSQVSGLTVKYQYTMANGVNFMGISDMPNHHTPGYPVVIPESQIYKTRLDQEYNNTRQPLLFPCTVEKGSIEEESFNGDVIAANSNSCNLQVKDSAILEVVSVKDYNSGITYEILDTPPLATPGTPGYPTDPSVWLVDNTSGQIKFNIAPDTGIRNVRVVYKLDNGITVNFVSDFQPGLPKPYEVSTLNTDPGSHKYPVETIVGDSTNQSYELKYNNLTTIEKVEEKGTGTEVNGCVVQNDQLYFSNGAPLDGVDYEVTYRYLKSSFEIYEVGLFNGKDQNDSMMFSIAGIGPITKDENTGMRVTWSITFEAFKN